MTKQGKHDVSRREFARRTGLSALGLGLASSLGYAPDAKSDDTAPFAVTHGPVVQTPRPGEATITWHTNRPAVARVMYGHDDALDHSAVASRDGLIPNDSTCHAVRLTGLSPGKPFQYRLISQEFKRYMTPYLVQFGETIESKLYTCAPMNPAKDNFSFLMWNDIHDDGKRLEAMFDDVSWDGVDFVVLNGDIINDFVRTEQFFNSFYDVCARRFGPTIPLVFIRGNHETRGPLARQLADYTPGRDGKPYYAFDHGAAHFLVLDTGEDKEDEHKEYAGLVDFSGYRDAQTRWLETDLASDAARNARYRIVLSHQPMAPVGTQCFGAQEARRLWRPLINDAGAQLWMSGHTHSFNWLLPGEDGDNGFHAMTNPQDATVRVDVTPEALAVSVIKIGGDLIHKQHIPQ